MHAQLSEYFEKRGLLFERQSGFRSGFSTDSCLIQLMDYLKHEISNGNFVGCVLLDLRKAFDTVNHGILIDKLKAVGVSSTDWFSSYLSGRSQCIEVNGVASEFLPITCGVPQDSILGPLLFLLYINDMNISTNCELSLYADDSALFFAHRDATVIGQRLSSELSNCKRWLVDNKLSLHVGKTECLLFGSKSRLRRAGDFQVLCEGTAVQRVSVVKYLGCCLDECLSGTVHVTNVMKACVGRLSFLYQNSKLLDFSTKNAMYVPHPALHRLLFVCVV